MKQLPYPNLHGPPGGRETPCLTQSRLGGAGPHPPDSLQEEGVRKKRAVAPAPRDDGPTRRASIQILRESRPPKGSDRWLGARV